MKPWEADRHNDWRYFRLILRMDAAWRGQETELIEVGARVVWGGWK
jgi:hypothetical protein